MRYRDYVASDKRGEHRWREADVATTVKFVDPNIRVKNVARAADWYRRMLGLKVEMAVPDKKKPAFARLTNGQIALMISDGSDPFSGKPAPKLTAEAITARKAQRVVSFYFRVDDGIDALYRSVKRKGARISMELADQPYGMREFAMKDPDGYEVAIGQPVT
jgi:uncharacterized glyoxalase superfamily protein PhnB